jgi:hypothetical protein
VALAFIFAATMFYQASRLLAMDAEKKVTESQEAGLYISKSVLQFPIYSLNLSKPSH